MKELTDLQRQHLAHRLDHKTSCGFITAGHICRMEGDWGEMALGKVFEIFMNNIVTISKGAKSHAFKVIQFDNFGTFF